MACVASLPIGVARRPLRLSPRVEFRRKRWVVRANTGPDEDVSEDAEDRIARLEAKARGQRATIEDEPEESEPSRTKRIWKEGELLPEEWENLTLSEKAWELYAGERGALFWANKVAFAAAIVLGVSWILFRFVGPQLGFYELKSTFTS